MHKTIAIRIKDVKDGNTQELERCGDQPLSAADLAQAEMDIATHQAQMVKAQENEYKELRRAEYPSIGDQLDAIIKGLAGLESIGQPIIELQQKILEIKTKYPKPIA